jgi:peptide/nickel transport system permease protein
MLPTTIGVLLLTFLLFNVVGGSPAEVVLGKNATAEALAVFDARHKYDRPLILGRWSGVRALKNVSFTRLKFDRRSAMAEVPLGYELPAGVYRLNAGKVFLSLRRIADNVDDEVMIDAPGEAVVFTVPQGWKVVRLLADGVAGRKLSLEQKNSAWWDTQFVHYVCSLFRGDLGVSTEYRVPVTKILKEGVGPSLSLTIPILVGGTLIGVMLGLLCAAWRGGWVDHVILVVSTILMSVNYVIWVLAGQFLLAFKLKLFPIWGYESTAYLVLPVLIGIFSGLGRDVRFFRAAILDEVYKPYVRTAQAKGLSGMRIMIRHVLRNSLIPVITYISLSIPFMFTGSLLLESFFGIPGLGTVSINAINSSDMVVVRAIVIMGALFYQAVNLITDLCYAWLDPRVRLS